MKASLQVGDVIHCTSSTADQPEFCYPAILGGQISNHWWVLSLQFGGSRIGWLSDATWHPKDACTTDSGKKQTLSYTPDS